MFTYRPRPPLYPVPSLSHSPYTVEGQGSSGKGRFRFVKYTKRSTVYRHLKSKRPDTGPNSKRVTGSLQGVISGVYAYLMTVTGWRGRSTVPPGLRLDRLSLMTQPPRTTSQFTNNFFFLRTGKEKKDYRRCGGSRR